MVSSLPQSSAKRTRLHELIATSAVLTITFSTITDNWFKLPIPLLTQLLSPEFTSDSISDIESKIQNHNSVLTSRKHNDIFINLGSYAYVEWDFHFQFRYIPNSKHFQN